MIGLDASKYGIKATFVVRLDVWSGPLRDFRWILRPCGRHREGRKRMFFGTAAVLAAAPVTYGKRKWIDIV